jgi:purine-binding chemotaxis protein CheW
MADSAAFRMVIFRLGPVHWAAPATVVREVIAEGPATRIPGSHAAVAGLVNLRGTLLTVVDGRRAVGCAHTATEPGSILVVEQDGRVCGVSVDEVLDLIEFPSAALAAGPAPAGVDPRLIRGFGSQAGRSFAVLDTEALLAPVLG